MKSLTSTYDVIVVGAGHAGYEAAHASAKMGSKTLLLTISLDSIGKLSCNPAIGGTAKGHLVREIDALGGIMGILADQTAIQYRMLNRSKGPAVWSPRAQVDRYAYQHLTKKLLEGRKNLDLFQGMLADFLVEEGRIVGITLQEGLTFYCHSLILCTGTFIKGTIHIGHDNYNGGRTGEPPSNALSTSLRKLSFNMGTLKTGTPPRIHKDSIDYSELEEQPSEDNVAFSFTPPSSTLSKISCHITYTNEYTQKIAKDNVLKSPMYSGKINSVGPRYCPSFEDKVTRFTDKTRHQIFLEPEGLTTSEVYVNGISTSLPFDVQLDMIHSIKGLENAQIMRPAYAIEYEYLKSGQLELTLESKKIKNLYFAGQINGTTGYEEAGAQGLIAGINASLKIQKKPPFILSRNEAYIGVLIEDIITKDLTEPYRMFTSRAEYRLLLRQDNADQRLSSYGLEYKLITEKRHAAITKKYSTAKSQIEILEKTFKAFETEKALPLSRLLSRDKVTYQTLIDHFPEHAKDWGKGINFIIETELKYKGYIEKQKSQILKFQKLENIKIPHNFDHSIVQALSSEAKEKLSRISPPTLSAASRIDGVTPADISILLIALKSRS